MPNMTAAWWIGLLLTACGSAVTGVAREGDTGRAIEAPAPAEVEARPREGEREASPQGASRCGTRRGPGPVACSVVPVGRQFGRRVSCSEESASVTVVVEHFASRGTDGLANHQGAPEDLHTSVISRVVATTYECGLRAVERDERPGHSNGRLRRFEHDARGNLVRETLTDLDGSRVFASERYEYDTAGRMISHARDGDGDGVDDSRATFDYNENGDVIRLAHDRDADGVIDTRCEVRPPCRSAPALHGCAIGACE